MQRWIAVFAVLAAFGCGKASNEAKLPEQVAPAAPEPAPQPAAQAAASAVEKQPENAEAAKQPSAAAEKPTVEVKIAVNGNAMKFDVAKISASVGQPVHVVLTNDKPGTLSHNWVLVKPGSEAKVAAAGLPVGLAGGYLADVPEILAHTAMIAPGNTTEVTFNAPSESGKYPYICTFPGHYLMMKGVLEVTP